MELPSKTIRPAGSILDGASVPGTPARGHKDSGLGFVKTAVALTTVVAVIVLLVVATAALATGSLGAGLAYLGGRDLYVSPRTISIFENDKVGHKVSVRNLAATPVQIIGYNAQCSCVRIVGLPVTVAPGDTAELTIRTGPTEARDMPVVFVTDQRSGDPPRLDVRILARR